MVRPLRHYLPPPPLALVVIGTFSRIFLSGPACTVYPPPLLLIGPLVEELFLRLSRGMCFLKICVSSFSKRSDPAFGLTTRIRFNGFKILLEYVAVERGISVLLGRIRIRFGSGGSNPDTVEDPLLFESESGSCQSQPWFVIDVIHGLWISNKLLWLVFHRRPKQTAHARV